MVVIGFVVDFFNIIIILCLFDGKIKFWDFFIGNLIDEINWVFMIKIVICCYYLGNDFIVFVCDDYFIWVVDIGIK